MEWGHGLPSVLHSSTEQPKPDRGALREAEKFFCISHKSGLASQGIVFPWFSVIILLQPWQKNTKSLLREVIVSFMPIDLATSSVTWDRLLVPISSICTRLRWRQISTPMLKGPSPRGGRGPSDWWSDCYTRWMNSKATTLSVLQTAIRLLFSRYRVLPHLLQQDQTSYQDSTFRLDVYS